MDGPYEWVEIPKSAGDAMLKEQVYADPYSGNVITANGIYAAVRSYHMATGGDRNKAPGDVRKRNAG